MRHVKVRSVGDLREKRLALAALLRAAARIDA
jgi:hypothetical protein